MKALTIRSIALIVVSLGAMLVSGEPLDFVKPPIELKGMGLGICTGDLRFIFTDRGGEEFQITVTYPPVTRDDLLKEAYGELDLRKRPTTVSVVHRDVTTATVDG